MPGRSRNGANIFSKSPIQLSQNCSSGCSCNVDAANEGVIEETFDAAGLDLETLFRAQYERIARVIAGVIRDPARAEELAVEVFLKWEQTRQAHGESAEGWLYRAAIRVALNELRRKTLVDRCARLLGFMTERKNGGSTPHDIYAAQEDRERVRLVLGTIEPRQAQLLLLRCNDFSYQELASILNINPASVGTLLGRALQTFRKEFIQRYGKERYGRE
jgi:RNA polymerase sigma-70 factor (ECF subfamily)